MSEYPSESDLERIKNWKLTCANDYRELAEFVCSLWAYPNFASLNGPLLRLHTGGWSGNEDIISTLEAHPIFYMVCWQKSERGGHHFFELPDPKVFDHGGSHE